MKKLIQLSEDRKRAYWKWEWDEQIPLSKLFTPRFADKMIDVTDMDPEPQEGWDYDGKVFIAPVVKSPLLVTDMVLLPGQGILITNDGGTITKRLAIDADGTLSIEKVQHGN